MAKWLVAAKRADFDKIAKEFQIDPVIARIIRNRDIIGEKEIDLFLHASLEDLHSPFLMKDMEKAASILTEKIEKEEKIRIIGDYDIDGICASYILKRGLCYLGANVDVAIPHRVKDGYGMNESLIQEAYDEGVQTIVTCDNGITAAEQVAYANTLGMTVIITDHHEIPYEELDGEKTYVLPEAAAVVDPKRSDCTYPFTGICGGAVAYKFVEAMLLFSHGAKEKKAGIFFEEEEVLLEELLEFVAFATVGDVMELVDENRILVKYGLRLLQHTKNKGMKALIEVNDLAEKQLSAYHIGFVLGPCLNATGRLDTAERAFALLEAKSRNEAVSIAGDLKALNDSRKEMTLQGVEEAVRQIEESQLKEDKVLVLYLPKCHESLAGIIAGRIRERYGKPTFVLTRGEEEIKGSGRSIDAFSMYEEMNKHKELFVKFGGHKLAAGLSLKEERIEDFRRAMNENCQLTEEDFEQKVLIDVPMPISYVNKTLIQQLEILEPFGNGNSKPVFAAKNIRFLSESILGKNKNVAKYVVMDESQTRLEMIYFGDLERFRAYIEEKYGASEVRGVTLSVIYYPTINEFRGSSSIQLVMQDYQ